MKANIYKVEILRLKGHGNQKYVYRFLKYLRKSQLSKIRLIKNFYRFLFHAHALRHNNEIFTSTKIGFGFCLWHPYNITIGSACIIGNNVTINKGALIGREFRGERNGCPIIGDYVWIGANAAIVGKITIGNNVLIAPNSFVNCDVPSNSVVYGNPCVIKHKDDATAHYIQNPLELESIKL